MPAQCSSLSYQHSCIWRFPQLKFSYAHMHLHTCNDVFQFFPCISILSYFIWMYVCMYVMYLMYVCACMYVCVCVMYLVHVCVCMHVCMYVHVHNVFNVCVFLLHFLARSSCGTFPRVESLSHGPVHVEPASDQWGWGFVSHHPILSCLPFYCFVLAIVQSISLKTREKPHFHSTADFWHTIVLLLEHF